MNKIIIFLSLAAAAFGTDAPPFWKSKPEVYKKMKEERYIVVSAHSNDVDGGKKLTVISAGIIHAPEDLTHQTILDFKEYPQFLSYILESPYDSKTKNIFFHGAILGYHVHMTIHIDSEKTSNGDLIKWKSIEGSYLGMEGTIKEESLDSTHTEISLDSAYTGKSLGLPTFILDWGLEIAAQRTAGSMRSHIESQWEKTKKH